MKSFTTSTNHNLKTKISPLCLTLLNFSPFFTVYFVMLKAIQILGCSSGFISQRLKKPHSGNGFSLISSKRGYSSTSLSLHPFEALKSRSFRVIRMFSSKSESKSDAPSSSSSSVAVHSAVSFFFGILNLDLFKMLSYTKLTFFG